MSNIIDALPSVMTKLTNYFKNAPIEQLLIGVLAIGIIGLILGSIQEDIVTANNVVVIVLVSAGMYYYFQWTYQKRIKNILTKNKILENQYVLDDLCKTEGLSDYNRMVCDQYKSAKNNFFLIRNNLLQQFKSEEINV
jgi:hypothetical protein